MPPTRQLHKLSLRPDNPRDQAFSRIIRSIPAGHVSTYGRIAAAAGYPLLHRAVANLLARQATLRNLPWHRVVGAGGHLKLRGDAKLEQQLRLTQEAVTFLGQRVNMDLHEHTLRPWETHETL